VASDIRADHSSWIPHRDDLAVRICNPLRH